MAGAVWRGQRRRGHQNGAMHNGPLRRIRSPIRAIGQLNRPRIKEVIRSYGPIPKRDDESIPSKSLALIQPAQTGQAGRIVPERQISLPPTFVIDDDPFGLGPLHGTLHLAWSVVGVWRSMPEVAANRAVPRLSSHIFQITNGQQERILTYSKIPIGSVCRLRFRPRAQND
jgi:hypothetical protein